MLRFINIAVFIIGLHAYLGLGDADLPELVHVIYRHGNRTPDTSGSYPNDPYINQTYYPYGFGQLTNKGKNTVYLLGKALRRRYDQFLGALYLPEILDSVSTNSDRTKMSLELGLAGLFPPHDTLLEWQKELNWQPIPYNYYSSFLRRELSLPFLLCPKYIAELISHLNTADGKDLRKKYVELFKYLKAQTGLNYVYFLEASNLYATLVAQEDLGFELPSWTKAVYPKQLEQVALDFFNFSTSTEKLKQLSGGFLLTKILNDTMAKVQNKLNPPGRKMFVYSAHDIHVIYILRAMNIDLSHWPRYGAYVLIEVYNINNVHGIKVFYQNYYSAVEPQILRIPGCDVFCSLSEVFRLLSNNLPKSENDCKILNFPPDSTKCSLLDIFK